MSKRNDGEQSAGQKSPFVSLIPASRNFRTLSEPLSEGLGVSVELRLCLRLEGSSAPLGGQMDPRQRPEQGKRTKSRVPRLRGCNLLGLRLSPPRVPPQGLLSPGVVGKGGIQLTGPPRASRPPSTPGHLFLPPLARIRNGLGPQPASERLPCLPTAKLRHRGRFRVGDDVRTSGGASSTGAPSLVHLLRKLRPWRGKDLDGRRLRVLPGRTRRAARVSRGLLGVRRPRRSGHGTWVTTSALNDVSGSPGPVGGISQARGQSPSPKHSP